MVTNHLRAPYGVFFTKTRTILQRPYGARPAAGRIVRFFINFLDIVRCPVKFRLYVKFHSARTAFGRVIWNDIGRAPYGALPAFAHIGRFLFKIQIVRLQRCSSGYRTVPDRASYDVWQAPETLKKLLSNRPMPFRAPDDARPGAGRCDMSRTATGEKRRVFAEVHIAFTLIFHF